MLDVDDSNKKIHLDSEGSVDIDGNTGITIDSSSGGIDIGTNLADGQNLTLGKISAAQMIFSPNSSSNAEKISLIKTQKLEMKELLKKNKNNFSKFIETYFKKN